MIIFSGYLQQSMHLLPRRTVLQPIFASVMRVCRLARHNEILVLTAMKCLQHYFEQNNIGGNGDDKQELEFLNSLVVELLEQAPHPAGVMGEL